MRTKHVYAMMISSALIAGQAGATFSLISFGGDSVSSNQASQASVTDLSGVPTAQDSIRQIGGFGVSLEPAANYTGPAFTGGAQAVKIGVNENNGLADAEIINDAGGDYIRLYAQTPSGVLAGSSLSYFTLFDAQNTAYGDLVSISGATAGGVSGSLVSRFMIETTGGEFYVSNTSISGGNGESTWSISNLETENWALFTPNTTEDWQGDFESLTFNQTMGAGTALSNIGWFASRPVDTGTNSALTIRTFDVVAVPEPASLVLIGIAVGALALVRRRS